MAMVAGVDFGTLSVRVSIVDSERGMLASAVSEYPLHRKREDPEYATQSHDDRMRASLLENAISLAATICWEWCRQKDERFVLAVAGTEPAVLDGITGNELGLRMLECLAVQEEAAAADRTGLLERLAQAPLPRGPVLAIGLDSVSLGRTLYALLNRPVVSLDVANLSQVDFYERPAIHVS